MTSDKPPVDSVIQQTQALNKQTYVSLALVLVLMACVGGGATQFARLSAEVGHLADGMDDVKHTLDKLEEHHLGPVTHNTTNIALILERMQGLSGLDARVRKLEAK